MSAAIRVEGLSKRYQLGARRAPSLYAQIDETLRRAWSRQPRVSPAPFWALRDVSLEVERGEVVSLIGRNGAGKSTLLKILARVTEPTAGRAELRGRVGSLLEVGTGFHAELTGRENVFLNAAILGMKRADIARQFDAIVDFAGIDGFIDTPVKRYSSGMFVRLAFAVAAHLEPEILLVDEVLAVGDAAFQRKCLGRIDAAVREGRTVVFVSHDMTAVCTLSRRAILLDGGRVVVAGPAGEVVRAYLQRIGEDARGARTLAAPADLPVAVTSVRTARAGGEPAAVIPRGDPLEITLEGEVRRPAPPDDDYFVAVDVRNVEGALLFRTHSIERRADAPLPRDKGSFAVTCRIPADLLPAGRYWVGVVSGVAARTELHEIPHALEIDVVQEDLTAGVWTTTAGMLTPRCAWRAA